MDIKIILHLATELGLPYIVRGNTVFFIGEEEIIEFKTEEKYQWQQKLAC